MMGRAWTARAAALILVVISACATNLPSTTPPARPTQTPDGSSPRFLCFSSDTIEPPSTLSCEAAVAAAEAVLPAVHLPMTAISFHYGAYCPPTARCAFVSHQHGYVVFHTASRGPQPDLFVRVEADAEGRVTVTSGPEAFPPFIALRESAEWEEPAAYSFTYQSRCGERNMLGTFQAHVEDGVVVTVKGLDERGRQAVATYRASEFPTLAAMLEKVRQARNRADAGDTSLTTDPTDGHPVSIEIDWKANSIDDEECYAVSEFAPTPTGGLSESQAIDAARLSLSDDGAPVWATMQGAYDEVFASLAHRPTYVNQPPPEDVAPDRMAWGVQFKVSVEVCGPSGTSCEVRDGLQTVLVDFATGAWLRTSTFAPSPGDALPMP